MRFRLSTAIGVLLAINFYTIPGSALTLGTTSNEYVKQVALLMLATLVLAWTSRLRWFSLGVASVLLAFAAFGVYASLTLAWSESVMESVRFINKLWLALALVAGVAAVRSDERVALMPLIETAMISYMVLTVVAEIFLRDVLNPHRIGDPRLAGFGDVHGTKYLMSIVTVYGFAVGLTTRRARWMLVSAVAGVLVVLSLQRAIIGATFIAILAVTVLEVLRRRTLWTTALAAVAIPLMTVGGAYAVFEYPPLRDRMFASEAEAALARRLVSSARIAEVMPLVQLRGRDQFWSLARSMDVPFGGLGYGTAAMKIEEMTGERWEVHNDFLKLRVETGPLGIVAYALFLSTLLVTAGYRAARTEEPLRAALYLAAFGCCAIAPLNGIFDNALDHVQKNLLYGTVFLLVAEGMRRTATDEAVRVEAPS